MDTTRVQNLLKQTTQELLDTPGLLSLHPLGIPPEQFRAFAMQRHALTAHFVSLLKRIVDLSKQKELTAVRSAARDNLHDELGLGKHHTSPQHGSHAQWRAHYMHALAIDITDISKDTLFQGTAQYNEFLDTRISTATISYLIGMLLFLEWSIPHEFRVIKACRDATLPQQFIILDADTQAIRKQKGLARLYLDHHISHDEVNHFPDLLHAAKTDELLLDEHDILQGIEDIARARIQFYESIQKNIFGV